MSVGMPRTAGSGTGKDQRHRSFFFHVGAVVDILGYVRPRLLGRTCAVEYLSTVPRGPTQ